MRPAGSQDEIFSETSVDMIVGNVHIVGFSLTGYGDPTSFGTLLQGRLRDGGGACRVHEISYGGLSVNALSGLIGGATRAVAADDWVGLELATSFMSLQRYTTQQAVPYVYSIVRQLLDRGLSKIFFVNLYRADLDDNDCVVQAISAVSRFFDLPVLDLKAPFRSRRTEDITVDGIHPSGSAREEIADRLLGFLTSIPPPQPRHRDAAGPAYGYVDLVPMAGGRPTFRYEARGKSIDAAVVLSGDVLRLSFDQEVDIEGYCFLYGPETGFVELQPDEGEALTLITFDEHSYYRRIGFRPVQRRCRSLAITVVPKTRDIALVRQTALPVEGRREFICGLVTKVSTAPLPFTIEAPPARP